jgi:hypothetical protein
VVIYYTCLIPQQLFHLDSCVIYGAATVGVEARCQTHNHYDRVSVNAKLRPKRV